MRGLLTLKSFGLIAVSACAMALAQPALVANTTQTGALMVERPTLISAGYEWRITGDDNRSAKVDVTYRKKGETAWRNAIAPMRLNGEVIQGRGAQPQPGEPPVPFDPNDPAVLSTKYVAPNMFAGSIFNLQPDSDYEVRLILSDADSVSGDKEKTFTVHTRKEPVPAPGGNVYHVYPADWKGARVKPYYIGLMAAYYYAAPDIDWQNAWPPRVKPGDTILMHAGTYAADRFHYMNGQPEPGHLSLGAIVDGTYHLTAKGTADKPIVIKNAGDGEVIFDGDGAQNLFNLMGADYNYFEGITIRNTNVAFLLGLKNVTGASGFTLKSSRLYDVGRAVQNDWSGAKDYYIADNVFIGRHDPEKMMTWGGGILAKFPGSPELVGGSIGSEYAVKVYGQGHVVAYNYFGAWHDGIDMATYGVPDGTPNEDPDRVPVSNDFYNNDFYNMGDNCIESDGGAHNMRIFRNRCFNVPGGAISAQPLWGGPVYFVQNVVYNTLSRTCKYSPVSGIYTWSNTFIGECRAGPAGNAHFANNLILSQAMGGVGAPVFALSTYTNYSSSDYNGYRPTPGYQFPFEWNSPEFSLSKVDSDAKLVTRQFKTLKEMQDATGQEKHSILVDYNSFQRVYIPDANDPQRVYKPEDYDFHLKPGSAAIDKGMVLDSITDGFTGRAPDLGAIETGQPAPHYGPRTPVLGGQAYGQTFRAFTGPPPPENVTYVPPKPATGGDAPARRGGGGGGD